MSNENHGNNATDDAAPDAAELTSTTDQLPPSSSPLPPPPQPTETVDTPATEQHLPPVNANGDLLDDPYDLPQVHVPGQRNKKPPTEEEADIVDAPTKTPTPVKPNPRTHPNHKPLPVLPKLFSDGKEGGGVTGQRRRVFLVSNVSVPSEESSARLALIKVEQARFSQIVSQHYYAWHQSMKQSLVRGRRENNQVMVHSRSDISMEKRVTHDEANRRRDLLAEEQNAFQHIFRTHYKQMQTGAARARVQALKGQSQRAASRRASQALLRSEWVAAMEAKFSAAYDRLDEDEAQLREGIASLRHSQFCNLINKAMQAELRALCDWEKSHRDIIAADAASRLEAWLRKHRVATQDVRLKGSAVHSGYVARLSETKERSARQLLEKEEARTRQLFVDDFRSNLVRMQTRRRSRSLKLVANVSTRGDKPAVTGAVASTPRPPPPRQHHKANPRVGAASLPVPHLPPRGPRDRRVEAVYTTVLRLPRRTAAGRSMPATKMPLSSEDATMLDRNRPRELTPDRLDEARSETTSMSMVGLENSPSVVHEEVEAEEHRGDDGAADVVEEDDASAHAESPAAVAREEAEVGVVA